MPECECLIVEFALYLDCISGKQQCVQKQIDLRLSYQFYLPFHSQQMLPCLNPDLFEREISAGEEIDRKLGRLEFDPREEFQLKQRALA